MFGRFNGNSATELNVLIPNLPVNSARKILSVNDNVDVVNLDIHSDTALHVTTFLNSVGSDCSVTLRLETSFFDAVAMNVTALFSIVSIFWIILRARVLLGPTGCLLYLSFVRLSHTSVSRPYAPCGHLLCSAPFVKRG